MTSKKTTVTALVLLTVLIGVTGCVGVDVSNRMVTTPETTRATPRTNDSGFEFPARYEVFHEEEGINFLLNRLYSLGYVPRADMVEAGRRISDRDSIIPVMEEMAALARQEGRDLSAAMYYRAAEFYTPWDDPRKTELRDLFRELFYRACDPGSYELGAVPYGGGTLATMKVASWRAEPLGTIVLHWGYDAFMEEGFSSITYLASQGYDVVTFDVPWMDPSAAASGTYLTIEWEKVVGAVLDYYELDDVALAGFSMGGWLAIRAAALDDRITRVVASSVSFDVNQYAGWFGQRVARFSIRRMPEFTNKQIRAQMESDPQQEWFFNHLMHITGSETPLEAAIVLSKFSEENLHSELVTQDVLILTGRDDHLVPYKMHDMQVRALVSARSVTPLVFTEASQGHMHCQIGNLGLALDLILDWLESDLTT